MRRVFEPDIAITDQLHAIDDLSTVLLGSSDTGNCQLACRLVAAGGAGSSRWPRLVSLFSVYKGWSKALRSGQTDISKGVVTPGEPTRRRSIRFSCPCCAAARPSWMSPKTGFGDLLGIGAAAQDPRKSAGASGSARSDLLARGGGLMGIGAAGGRLPELLGRAGRCDCRGHGPSGSVNDAAAGAGRACRGVPRISPLPGWWPPARGLCWGGGGGGGGGG